MAPAKAVYAQAEETESVFVSDVRARAMRDARNEVFAQQGAIAQNVSREIRRSFSGKKAPEVAIRDAQRFVDAVLGQ